MPPPITTTRLVALAPSTGLTPLLASAFNHAIDSLCNFAEPSIRHDALLAVLALCHAEPFQSAYLLSAYTWHYACPRASCNSLRLALRSALHLPKPLKANYISKMR